MNPNLGGERGVKAAQSTGNGGGELRVLNKQL